MLYCLACRYHHWQNLNFHRDFNLIYRIFQQLKFKHFYEASKIFMIFIKLCSSSSEDKIEDRRSAMSDEHLRSGKLKSTNCWRWHFNFKSSSISLLLFCCCFHFKNCTDMISILALLCFRITLSRASFFIFMSLFSYQTEWFQELQCQEVP